MNLPKLIVIIGPTASGKTSLAIRLAKKFNGEIVSADSRQIYKELSIGSSKVTPKEAQGIKHYLIDIVSLKDNFSAQQFKELAIKAIREIIKKGKVPFLVGGTGFYVQTVVDNLIFPKIEPNNELRKNLSTYPAFLLFKILQILNPQRANQIDPNNERRLIRAIEISQINPKAKLRKGKPLFKTLILGIYQNREDLNKAIEKRFNIWLKQGFLDEVKKLMENYKEEDLKEIGLHYYWAYLYLIGFIDYETFIKKSLISLKNYAKRQLTWFKRDNRVIWIKNYSQAQKLVKKFLEIN